MARALTPMPLTLTKPTVMRRLSDAGERHDTLPFGRRSHDNRAAHAITTGGNAPAEKNRPVELEHQCIPGANAARLHRHRARGLHGGQDGQIERRRPTCVLRETTPVNASGMPALGVTKIKPDGTVVPMRLVARSRRA